MYCAHDNEIHIDFKHFYQSKFQFHIVSAIIYCDGCNVDYGSRFISSRSEQSVFHFNGLSELCTRRLNIHSICYETSCIAID